MKCTVTNISAVTQTIFPEAGSESIAAGDKFTGEFSPERVEEMTLHQPGKFSVVEVPNEPAARMQFDDVTGDMVRIDDLIAPAPTPVAVASRKPRQNRRRRG